MLEVLLEVLKVVAALFALMIAYAGLNTWVRQLNGTGEYEVARRILKGLVTIREAVWHVRARGIREGEFRRAAELAMNEDRVDDQPRIRQIVHEIRWQYIQSLLSKTGYDVGPSSSLW